MVGVASETGAALKKFLPGSERSLAGGSTRVRGISEVCIVDSRNSATAPAGCGISEEWSGRIVVISVSGTLDMLTSPQLAEAIATAFLKNPSAMIIDLSGVDFLASAGMGVLVAASDRADGKLKFAVVADGPATSRPLTLVGLAEVLGLQPSVERARLAIGLNPGA